MRRKVLQDFANFFCHQFIDTGSGHDVATSVVSLSPSGSRFDRSRSGSGVQIAAGIVMVHGKAGWFVVGAGRNGAEYSVLILACLLVLALTDSVSYKPRIGTHAPR